MTTPAFVKGPFGKIITREQHYRNQRNQLRGLLKQSNARAKALNTELALLRKAHPNLMPAPEEAEGPKEVVDGFLAAMEAKREEAAKQLAEARVGSRSEKVLREALQQYQRLIDARRRELEKSLAPKPPAPLEEKRQEGSRRRQTKKANVYSPIF